MTTEQRAYHHGDLRGALLAEARKTLDLEGDVDLSLRGLARAVGVSVNAPYRHFADKNALLAALAAQGFEELVIHFATAGTGAVGMLEKCVAYLEFAQRNPGLYRIMFGPPLYHLHLDADLLQASGAAFQSLRDSIAETKQMSLTEPEVTHDSVSVWSTLHGFVMLRQDRALDWIDPDFVPDARRLARYALAGILGYAG